MYSMYKDQTLVYSKRSLCTLLWNYIYLIYKKIHSQQLQNWNSWSLPLPTAILTNGAIMNRANFFQHD